MNQKGVANIALIALVVILVGIIGYFVLVRTTLPIRQTTETPSPTQITLPSETANWKTYKNDVYNYELKYPASWYFYDKGNLVYNPGLESCANGKYSDPKKTVLFSKDKIAACLPALTHGWGWFNIWVRDWQWSAEELNRTGIVKSEGTYDSECQRELDTTKYEQITFKGLAANKSVALAINAIGDEPGTQILFNYKDRGWQITYPNDCDGNPLDPAFDQILSTFKFLDQNFQTSSCTPKFKVESGPELTASEAYSQKCYEAKTKEECEKVDIYRESTQNFGNSDGIPDCNWTEEVSVNLKEILPGLPGGTFVRDKLELDVDQDGKNEILALYVLSARIEGDPSPWCGNLTGEKLLGDFYLALIDQNKLQSQVKLIPEWFENGGESKNEKLINPRDLNGDGKELEFTFSRYAGCNGYDRQIVGYSFNDKKLKSFPFYRDGNEEIAVFGSFVYENGFLIRRFYSQIDGYHKVYYEYNSELEKFFFQKEEINCCEPF